MSWYVVKPENVLKRADEFIAVGKKKQALEVLYEFLSLRRNRQWQPAHIQVMERFMDLCVDSRNNFMAKEGLHQYRNLCQVQAPQSLETVIEYMLNLAEKRVKEMSAVCDRKTVDDVEDLENDKTPESILLESVSSEQNKERTEREVLVPWLRFMWESYRSTLEILRGNHKLANVYQRTALRTMKFCVEYSRKVEFRKLCDTMRNHTNRTRDRDGPAPPEALELQLATRFEQLKVASQLKLWNEGFRTIEDIHSIFMKTEQRPSSQLEATYYQKLTDLFLVAENYLFHAYAYRAYFQISVEKNKSLTPEESATMASCVLLAAMSIPLKNAKAGTTYGSKSVEKQKNNKLAVLLGFETTTDREALMKELVDDGILELVTPETRVLFLQLERSFAPLKLAAKAGPILNKFKADERLQHYVEPLEQLLIVRVISQLAQVYYSVRLEYLQKMMEPLNQPWMSIESYLIKAIKTRQIEAHSLTLDHTAGCIRFGEDIMEEQRTQWVLTDMARGLKSICAELEPKGKAKLYAEARAARAKTVLEHLSQTHQEVLRRRDIISKRKDDHDREQHARKVDVERRRKEAEAARKKAEAMRLQKHKDARAQKELDALEEEKKQFELKQRLIDEGVDVSQLSKNMTSEEQEKLIEETRKKALDESIETEKKLIAAAKRLDTRVRALREKEIPKLKKLYEERLVKDEEDHKKGFAALKAKSLDEHKKNLENKATYAHMQKARKEFEDKLMARWNEEYEADRQERWEECDRRLKLAKLDRARKTRAKASKEIEMRKAEAERVERERQKQERLREEQEREEQEREEQERQEREERMRSEREQYGGDRMNDGPSRRPMMDDAPPTDRPPMRYEDDGGRFGMAQARGGDDGPFGGERRGFGGDRGGDDGPFGGERRGFGGDRGGGRFGGDRGGEDGPFGGDRRGFGGDRGGFGGGRGGFSGGRGGGAFGERGGGERAGYEGERGGFGGGRGGFGGERGERGGFGGGRGGFSERPGSSAFGGGRSNYGERNFGGEGGERSERGFGGGRGGFGNSERGGFGNSERGGFSDRRGGFNGGDRGSERTFGRSGGADSGRWR
ncbi:Eukaryotic translation initiation factor 3 subunit A [Hondaea fermentalgiana]|uniref:Eukaryotic translation initiation factor 3 subunit A n=1 Tax=Hondaea fermentalgiana TaxID=2315210 RepID=A0A2R5GLQ4_9STRA|nr:Eukaryotic translation initiation factor 3 subunit A [Hondaea fermentalgiana]|eukprot:GBG31832.1 Eukaryotic translation initiation factor 3 subunit A [Hondaea fermentalgiana]